MRIEIKFYEDDGMEELVCKETTSNVLDAEGALQHLARFYQSREKDRLEDDNENNP